MKAIRKEFNLSQQELALLLNVSRSTIAMFENGLRALPARASKQWTQLLLLWQEYGPKNQLPRGDQNQYLKVQQKESMNRLNAQVQRAAARSVSLAQQLAQQETQYPFLVKRMHLLKALMRETPAGSSQMALLKNRAELTQIQLAACCPQRRQLLVFRLQALTALQKAALAGAVIVQQQG
ncbi:helix-turn-helix transcriptional regulator [Niabella sp.]|uniref:helix-turn-helix transcriptional regulator n=1 Tax=Niabella sp. TaxID=1962976 RepID=UPI00261ABBAC|nr:helix-turn-helix transcriptional regulator [Niabella sp.]